MLKPTMIDCDVVVVSAGTASFVADTLGTTGDRIALAYAAGADLVDLEPISFGYLPPGIGRQRLPS